MQNKNRSKKKIRIIVFGGKIDQRISDVKDKAY